MARTTKKGIQVAETPEDIKAGKEERIAALPFKLSTQTLVIAHECIGNVPSKNAKQSVALANALLEIEEALRRQGKPVVEYPEE